MPVYMCSAVAQIHAHQKFYIDFDDCSIKRCCCFIRLLDFYRN